MMGLASDFVGTEVGLEETPDRRKSRSGSLGGLAASVSSAASVGSAGSEGHERRRRRKECDPPSTTTSKAGVLGGCMKSPTVACASKVATRRVSFTSADLTESADSGSSSLHDSSLSKEPTSGRAPIMPPPPPRIANGDMGVGQVASQGYAGRLLQQPVPPSPLAMVGRSGPAEDSPLVVRGASLKLWTRANSHLHAPPDLAVPWRRRLAWWVTLLARSRSTTTQTKSRPTRTRTALPPTR